MLSWSKAVDILVLPNSGKTEISRIRTSPMKMFEYMASKRPIIASNLSSLREILNKDNSILVSPDSPRDIFDGIKIVWIIRNYQIRLVNKPYKTYKTIRGIKEQRKS